VTALAETFYANSKNDPDHADLWVMAAAQFPKRLSELASFGTKVSTKTRIVKLTDPMFDQARAESEDYEAAFMKYGSDKSLPRHQYHIVYKWIMLQHCATHDCRKMRTLEIGLGKNNTRLISTMGQGGRPGASLRGFRDLLPEARVFGADIDRDILFLEDRIRTAYVNQLDPASFDHLYAEFGSEPFDLVIDDGLHSLGANLNTLVWALSVVKTDSWIVIEDIHALRLPPFDLIDQLLAAKPAVIERFMIECGAGPRKVYLYVLRVDTSKVDHRPT